MRARRDPANPLPTMTTSHDFNSGRTTDAARGWRLRAAADVRESQALHPLCAALLTRRQPIDIPQVGGYDRVGKLQGEVERFFELRQRRWREMPQLLETFHLSIPAAHGDDRDDRHAALDRMLDGAHCPRDRFFRRNVRCTEEDKDADIDAVLREKARRRIKSREIEPFVEMCGRDGMNSLESNGDFEPARDLSSERERARADGVGVRFDGDSLE